jgi:glycosyltransferase involved in cell wall biosynthesis
MTLGLVMIVKNASNCIRRTLESVKSHISSYCILDTGSTDNTIPIIRDTMKGIKGHIYHEPFTDFSTARNRALELFGEKEPYVIMLDDSYILHNPKKLVEFLKTADKSSYHISILDSETNRQYYSNRIFKTSSNIRYKYKVHEVPDTTDVWFVPSDISITDMVDGIGMQRSKERYVRDIEMLKEYPDDRRCIYFLGMTYYKLEQYEMAVKYFEKLEFNEEFLDEYLYDSMYYSTMIRLKEMNTPLYDLIPRFKRMCELFPTLAEPIYRLAILFYNEGAINRAHLLMRHAITLKEPSSTLFGYNKELYDFELKYLYVFITFYTRDLDESKRVFQELKQTTTDDSKKLRLDNLEYMLYPETELPKHMLLCDKPLIVIHTGHFAEWTPETIHETASGSEIMAFNIARELVKLGNYVVIFGNVTQTGFVDDVEFKHMSEYYEYIKSHVVQVLITSRDVNNLIFLPNILKVYFWVHDILPRGGDVILARKDRFGGFLCVSEWQRDRLMKDFAITPDVIHVTRNAIYTDRFTKSVSRIPYRFIYHSGPDRGLTHLLTLAPRIKEKYPSATFEVFCSLASIGATDMKHIQNMPYVHIRDRVSQEQIATELIMSDVWLYPTDFKETYCISALEAQASGCLCISMNVGAMKEVIGDRGVIIDGDIQSKEIQDKLLNKMYFVMDRPVIKERLVQKAHIWAMTQTFERLACEWNEMFRKVEEVDMEQMTEVNVKFTN